MHLGIAVNLEQGLVVPVVRDADEMTMAELSARAKQLVDKARGGGLAPDEMSGSTFTISNMGMLDVENFTAIINPGESAILAVSSTDQEAGRARRRDRRPADHEDDAVVRSSPDRRRDGGPLRQQHQDQARG